MADNTVGSRRDAQAMEARRLGAIPLLRSGESLSSIARRLNVSRQAVFVWSRQLRRRGQAGLRRRRRSGRPPKLRRAQLAQLPRLLAQGAEAYGFSTSLWTTQRVADLIWRRFQVRYDRDHVCRLLHRFGWSWQKPARRARERDEAAIQRWVKHTWPRVKKNAQKLKAKLVFLDESGFSLLPTACKTWAPQGCTPVLWHCFNWPKLSAISAVTPHPRAHLRLVRGTIRSAELIAFVRHLLRQIPGLIFLFWDGLNTHRSKQTRAALEQYAHRLRVYRLSAYAPELNPDEGLWGWMKQHALAGHCPPHVEALEHSVRLALRRLRRHLSVIRSFFHRCPLYF